MLRQFDGQVCVFCRRNPSSPTGEHAWTEWFLDRFPASAGPYHLEVNGVAETKRDGVTIRTQSSFDRVKVPSCTGCNGIMAHRFEDPAKSIVRSVLEGVVTTLSPADAETVGLWLVKTWLVLAHSAARSSWPGITPERWDVSKLPEDLYDWMINGAAPPAGLSLWVAREDRSLAETVNPRRIPLPTVLADGRTIAFQSFESGVHWVDGTVINIALIYHPDWDIVHPLEAEGRARRLWPPTGAPVDLGSLPGVAVRDTLWDDGPDVVFAPGVYGVLPLPALEPGMNLMDVLTQIPGVVGAAAPKLR